MPPPLTVIIIGLQQNIWTRFASTSLPTHIQMQFLSLTQIQANALPPETFHTILFDYNETGTSCLQWLQRHEISSAKYQICALLDPADNDGLQYLLQQDIYEILWSPMNELQFALLATRLDHQIRTGDTLAQCCAPKSSTNLAEIRGKTSEFTQTTTKPDPFHFLNSEIPIMFAAFDEEGHFVHWSSECERVTGYSRAEVCHNPGIWQKFYPDPVYRHTMLTKWSQRESNERDWVWELTCKDGSVKNISWSIIPGLVLRPIQTIHVNPSFHGTGPLKVNPYVE